MQFKIFTRRSAGVAALAGALAVAGFVGLRAAEHEANPPANVKMMPSSYAGSHHGYSAVIKQVVPAVVNISSSKMVKQQTGQNMIPDELFRQFFGDQFGGPEQGGQGRQFEGRQFNVPHAPQQEQRETGTGSGVIVSPEGYILTNNHVVDGATAVTVTLHDKREFKAKVIGTDPRTDIAVIKIDGSGFPTLTLADSDKVDVGDIVLAIGDPFGVGQTVTQGIVSATGRSLGGQIEQIENFIQTDAAINPGNSGGALVDDEGHLVGINTAIVGNSGGNVGIGFAVPINMAKHDMDSILAHGKVDRGYLGVQIEDVSPALAKAFHTTSTGALIGDVTAGSPAANAGLKQGDIVTELNGQLVPDRDQLRTRIGTMDPGTKVNLKVLRDGRPMDLALTLGSFPEDKEQHAANIGPSEHSASGLDGVSVENLTPEIAHQLKVAPQTKGVAVSSVAQSSRAFEAGLQEGDVIMEVNRHAVSTPGEFDRAIGATPKDSPVLLLVNRGGATTFIAIS
jgi:serine protease Do